ncbi:hypothetical protein DUP91_25850, partial [Salmonella enterica subsp. enterica]|nr:hypothetical protein [Salmonella enterica subsp. enterica]
LVRDVGLPLKDVLRAATANPARLMGLEDRIGLLKPGHPFDAVLLDADLRATVLDTQISP